LLKHFGEILILYVSKTYLQHYIATCNVATFLKYSWKFRCCMGNRTTVSQQTDITHSETIKYFAIPYIRNISETTVSIINKSNLKVGFRSLNKINKFIRVHKDQTEHTHKKNVVYKIHYKDCDVSYVEQTKRQLRTRVKEHHNNFKLDESKHSVVSEHMLSCYHSFDWNQVRILDTTNIAKD